MSIFFMMVGLPYSGKSVYAEGLREKFGAVSEGLYRYGDTFSRM